MATEDLSYGEGSFNFAFKNGSVLKLMPDGHFEHSNVVGVSTECVQSQVSEAPILVKPQFGDSEEAHILSGFLGLIATSHVVMRGLLALRREKNRSLEAIQTTRAFASVEEHKRIE